jgi:hypothetical protein
MKSHFVPNLGERTAHAQLVPLKEQVRELELLMAKARSVLDLTETWIPWPPLPRPTRPKEIARRGLYRRRDGLPPATRDVSARVSAYPGLFRRDGWFVQLRLSPPGTRRSPRRYLHQPLPWPG